MQTMRRTVIAQCGLWQLPGGIDRRLPESENSRLVFLWHSVPYKAILLITEWGFKITVGVLSILLYIWAPFTEATHLGASNDCRTLAGGCALQEVSPHSPVRQWPNYTILLKPIRSKWICSFDRDTSIVVVPHNSSCPCICYTLQSHIILGTASHWAFDWQFLFSFMPLCFPVL